MSDLHVRITGTEAELKGFLGLLGYEEGLRVVETRRGAPVRPLGDEPFGVSEVVSLCVEIATALGTTAAYDIMSSRFRRYRDGRRHMEIERIDPAPDEQEGESGDGRED
ncbi:hypothetical protein ACWDUX_10925 [Streptomyces sp. NPDC003444]